MYYFFHTIEFEIAYLLRLGSGLITQAYFLSVYLLFGMSDYSPGLLSAVCPNKNTVLAITVDKARMTRRIPHQYACGTKTENQSELKGLIVKHSTVQHSTV